MRAIVLASISATLMLVSASRAQTLITSVDYQYLGNNFAGTTIAADPNAAYSCLSNLQAGSSPGSSGGVPPRTFVKLDDFVCDASAIGQKVQSVRFVMWNAGGFNGARITQGSLQLGFWMSDGAGGLPESYLNESGRLIGYTTPLHEFDLGATVMTIHLGDSGFTLGSSRLWLGFTWEGLLHPPQNQGGAESLGYVVGSSPTVGQTNSGGVRTDSYGVPFGQSPLNPVFSQARGQFAVEFIVPSPAAATVFVVGGIAFAHRRRR